MDHYLELELAKQLDRLKLLASGIPGRLEPLSAELLNVTHRMPYAVMIRSSNGQRAVDVRPDLREVTTSYGPSMEAAHRQADSIGRLSLVLPEYADEFWALASTVDRQARHISGGWTLLPNLREFLKAEQLTESNLRDVDATKGWQSELYRLLREGGERADRLLRR